MEPHADGALGREQAVPPVFELRVLHRDDAFTLFERVRPFGRLVEGIAERLSHLVGKVVDVAVATSPAWVELAVDVRVGHQQVGLLRHSLKQSLCRDGKRDNAPRNTDDCLACGSDVREPKQGRDFLHGLVKLAQGLACFGGRLQRQLKVPELERMGRTIELDVLTERDLPPIDAGESAARMHLGRKAFANAMQDKVNRRDGRVVEDEGAGGDAADREHLGGDVVALVQLGVSASGVARDVNLPKRSIQRLKRVGQVVHVEGEHVNEGPRAAAHTAVVQCRKGCPDRVRRQGGFTLPVRSAPLWGDSNGVSGLLERNKPKNKELGKGILR